MPDRNYSRTVYTTESGRVCPNCGQPVASCQCKKKTARSAGDGIVRVSLDKKGRGGKTVTLITGLPGTDEFIQSIATELKRRCGAGGAVKDGVVEIQGDHRETLVEALKAKGLTVKRAGG